GTRPEDGPVARLADHARTVVDRLEAAEDRVHGGFGGAPKFPVAPTLELLLDLAASSVVDPEVARRALVLAGRTVDATAASPLRDVDGGFFRYGTRPDWSEPHYERMLYDNAQLLSAATTLAVLRRTGPAEAALRTPAATPGATDPGDATARVAADVGRFLLRVLRLPGGAFASAPDSESVGARAPTASATTRPRSTPRCSRGGTGSRSRRSRAPGTTPTCLTSRARRAPPPTVSSRRTCAPTARSCGPRRAASCPTPSRRSRTT